MVIKIGKILPITIVLCIFSSMLAWPHRVFCYDSNIAHPNIAQMAGVLYNKHNDKKLTTEEISWMMEGAKKEDTPTRWLNHFYDPIYNVGLKNTQTSAKEWVESPYKQTDFSLGDRSWQRAVDDYNKGDNELAMKELGHSIHLVSDMLVPAHTRDDVHVLGDSFEGYVKNNWNKIYTEVKGKDEYKEFENLNKIFDEAALYSNNNFYSDDTVENFKYKIPDTTIVRELVDSRSEFYLKNNYADNLLMRYDRYNDWKKTIDDKVADPLNGTVLSSYSTHLIPKAVGYSAGTIKLFFDATAKQEKTKLPFFRTSLKGYGDEVVSVAVTAAEDTLDYAKSKYSPASPLAQETLGAPEGSLKEGSLKDNQPVVVEETKTDEIKTPLDNSLDDQSGEPTGPTESSPVDSSNTSNNSSDGSSSSGGGSPSSSFGSGSTPAVENLPQTSTSTPDTPTSTPPIATTTPAPATPTLTAPVLDNKFSQIIYTTSSAYDIFGTCSTDTIKIVGDLTSSSTVNQFDITPSSTNWSYNSSLDNGHNYFQLVAEGDGGVTSTPASAHIVYDVIPPPVPTIIAEESSATSGLHVVLTGQDELSPTFYDLYYFLYTSSTSTLGEDDWILIAENTTSTVFDIPAERGLDYTFKARAVDSLGNDSEWTDKENGPKRVRLDWSKEVVINEVSWAGTQGDSLGKNDEWFELYNNTDQEINLEGWTLAVTDRIISFPSSTIIYPKSYFLMERGDDDTVVGIAADYIFTLQYGINNSGENLKLINSQKEIVDQVDCTDGWFAGSAVQSEYASMARIGSTVSGNIKDNWRTSGGPTKAAAMVYDKFHLIYGSPKEINQELKVLKGTQQEEELVLSKEQNGYLINYFTVGSTSTLKIEPGVELYLPQYSCLYVDGNLQITGNESERVTFQPLPSSTRWGTIYFENATADIKYSDFIGGNLEPRIYHDGALAITSSTVNLENIKVWNSRIPGKNIKSTNSLVTIKNSQIGADVKMVNNFVPGVTTVGIFVKGGEITLDSDIFTNLIVGANGGSYSDNFPTLKLENPDSIIFDNVDYPWQPTNWLTLIASSTPT